MKHPRLKKEYAGCYTYTGNTDEFRISQDYHTGLHRRVWKVFTVPITTSNYLFLAGTLKEAVKILDEPERNKKYERNNQH